jgi:hypothetical protein
MQNHVTEKDAQKMQGENQPEENEPGKEDEEELDDHGLENVQEEDE